MSMLNYDQNKDKNKSKTLSIKCVQRLKEKFCCVISPHYINICIYVDKMCVYDEFYYSQHTLVSITYYL